MNRILCLTIIFLFLWFNHDSFCQNYHLLNNDAFFCLEKELIKTEQFHSAIRPVCVPKTIEFQIKDSLYKITTSNNYVNRLLNQSLITIKHRNISTTIHPVFSSIVAQDFKSKNSSFLFDAGLDIQFSWKEFLSFQTNLVYSIEEFPDFVAKPDTVLQIVPHFGKYLNQSDEFYSFSTSGAYLSVTPSEYFNFHLGYGKTFIGNGYRSLLISDNSNQYPFFQINTDVWRLKYSYMISAMKDIDSELSDNNLHRKYTVSHILSYNVTQWLNCYFYETVITASRDSIGANRGLDWNYLNPFVFFRPIEFSAGSPDNVLLGFGGSIKILKKYQLYFQAIIDEFVLSNVKERNGWWGNKHGFQAGIKGFDFFGIRNLYLQGEINFIRPYVYSHANTILNNGNYLQEIAHPYGANLQEILGIIRYDYKRISIKCTGILTRFGADSSDGSYGQNIYKPYTMRFKDYDNKICQGVETKVFWSQVKIAYLINPVWNFQIEAGAILRKETSILTNRSNYVVFFGIRTNLYNREWE